MVRGVDSRGTVLVLVSLGEPLVEHSGWREHAVGATRSYDRAVGEIFAEAFDHSLAGDHDVGHLRQNAAWCRLQDVGLQIAAPKRVLNDLGVAAQQGGDLRSVLAGAKLRRDIGGDLRIRAEYLQRFAEVR